MVQTMNVRLGALSLAAFTLSCTTAQRVATETLIARTMVSDEQETQLGLQVHSELQRLNTRFSTNETAHAYVKGLLGKLIPLANKERNVDWQFFLIDDLKTVNAFATPGGRIYVYTGLLAAAGDEAEVVGVLGHELGHVVGRHTARQLVEQNGISAVAALALGKNPSQLGQLVAGLLGNGAMLAHSRASETESDEYGARYADAAGYAPQGLARFFERLDKQQGRTPAILTWLSTHPSPDQRVAHINAFIAQAGLKGTDTGADRLAAVQRSLK